MSAQPLVCTILPTYNERGNISLLIERLLASVSAPYLVLVIDDDSPDGTWRIVKEMAEKYPNAPQSEDFTVGVALVRRTQEKGLTSAIQRGIQEAIYTHGAEIITWMDCDTSFDATRRCSKHGHSYYPARSRYGGGVSLG